MVGVALDPTKTVFRVQDVQFTMQSSAGKAMYMEVDFATDDFLIYGVQVSNNNR